MTEYFFPFESGKDVQHSKGQTRISLPKVEVLPLGPWRFEYTTCIAKCFFLKKKMWLKMHNSNVQLLKNANFIFAFFFCFICTLTRIFNYAVAECFLCRTISGSVHKLHHQQWTEVINLIGREGVVLASFYKWRSRPTEFKLKFTQVWIMQYETPSAALFSLMFPIARTDWKNSCV